MSDVVNSPSTAASYQLKHSVTKISTSERRTCVTCLHVYVPSLKFPFVKSFIIINQHNLSPLFLVYSVRHVVSCLLMDSHWSSTCNWVIAAAAQEWFNLLTVRPMLFTFLGKILSVHGRTFTRVMFRINEFAWLNRPKRHLTITQKWKIMSVVGYKFNLG